MPEERTADAAAVPPASGSADSPGVLLPPPLLWFALLLAGLGLDALLDLEWGWPPLVRGLGLLFFTAGAVLAFRASRQFRRAGTPVPTWQATRTLVGDGLYRRSRNPIYVGMILGYAGAAWLLASPIALALLPVLVAVLRYGVIAREERYLESLFGDPYRAYCGRVPRWL